MGKKAQSAGKGGRGGQTDRSRQLGKQEESKLLARLGAQRTRLQRALAKAEKLPADSAERTSALIAVHQDGVETYREYSSTTCGSDDWVQGERLKHMSAMYDLAPECESVLSMREEYVLLLLVQSMKEKLRCICGRCSVHM